MLLVMKELVLFANVNPLAPNEVIPVWSSKTCGSTNESDWWRLIDQKRVELTDKGYQVEIHEIITTIFWYGAKSKGQN